MKRLLLSLLVTMIVGCATEPTKWDKTEKQLMWLYVGGQIVDYGQTNDIYENEDEYHEMNPVVDEIHEHGGKTGWAAWKIGTTAGVGLLADRLEPKWRKALLATANIIVWGLVTNNLIVGLQWSW